MLLDLNDPEFTKDPYQFYHELRSRGPIHLLEPSGVWLVTGYEAAIEVLRSPHIFSSQVNAAFDPLLLGADPPQHSERRRALDRVSGAFTRNQIRSLGPTIREHCLDLLQQARASSTGRLFLVEEYASVLPSIMILSLLGISVKEARKLRDWTRIALSNFESEFAATHWSKLKDFLRIELSRIEEHGSPGLIAELLGDTSVEHRFNREETISLAKILLVGGNETTTHLISSSILALLRDQELLRAVRSDRSLIAPLIEETLRHQSPVQIVHRIAKERCELLGETLMPQAMVGVGIGAANRDPGVFIDPDSFDIRRSSARPIPFGFGAHYCIGVELARLEASIAVEELLKFLPELRAAQDLASVVYQRSANIRGVSELALGLP